MEVRDAVEADAGRLASIGDAPTDVMRNLVHDRTVRVAEADDAADPADLDELPENGETSEGGDLLGFVSFDARDSTVHVTQVEGEPDAVERLLDEPVRFARAEGMNVEMLVADDQAEVGEAASAAGFREVGPGPQFDGTPTTRYRMEP
jgi:hypothetical protein